MVKIARRTLVAASLSTVAASLVPASIAPAMALPSSEATASDWLPADLLGGNFADLGRHLLADEAVRAELPASRAALAAGLQRRLGGASGAAVRPAVQERIRADFAAGDTVTAAGWVLSRTEVMLCCLAARNTALT